MSGANASAATGVQDRHGAEQSSQAPSHEPSMEEILASIRRIISDDQMLPLSPRASPPPLPPASTVPRDADAQGSMQPQGPASDAAAGADENPHEPADVLDLADIAQHEHDEPHRLETQHEDDLQAREHQGPQHGPRPMHEAPEPSEAPEAAQTAAALAPQPPTRESQRAHAPYAVHAPEPVPAPDRVAEPLVSAATMSSVSSHFQQLTATMLMQNFPPVDNIARELLRPMIKTWLDDNLPVMVERLVRAEIERVARVGR